MGQVRPTSSQTRASSSVALRHGSPELLGRWQGTSRWGRRGVFILNESVKLTANLLVTPLASTFFPFRRPRENRPTLHRLCKPFPN